MSLFLSAHFWILLEPPWAFLSIPDPSWTFVSLREPSWAFVNLREYSWTFLNLGSGRFTKVCEGSLRFTKAHEGSRRITKAHEGSRRFKKAREGSGRFKKVIEGRLPAPFYYLFKYLYDLLLLKTAFAICYCILLYFCYILFVLLFFTTPILKFTKHHIDVPFRTVDRGSPGALGSVPRRFECPSCPLTGLLPGNSDKFLGITMKYYDLLGFSRVY